MRQNLKKNSASEESHSSADRYLITYADLITLLLGLFVILYASSQVDAGKYSEFSEALNQYFKDGKPKLDSNTNKSVSLPINSLNQEKSIDQISVDLGRSLASQISKNNVSIQCAAEGITIRLPERLLFESGKAEIKNDALSTLDSIVSVLEGVKQQIVIQGHTDNVPIHNFQFESNWHLSVGRAVNIGYYCIRKGIPENNLSIVGYGSEHPIADNAIQNGRAVNRRVEIVIKDAPINVVPSIDGYFRADTSAQSKNNK